MKKNLILLFTLVFCVNLYAQTNSDSIAHKEAERIQILNQKCKLQFTDAGLVSMQDTSKNYLVYEVPGLSALELKASTLNTISSMHSSPKDVVTSLSDNMIQLEGYISRAYYYSTNGSNYYPADLTFAWTMQFKDGKIRINIPKLKQFRITEVPVMGSLGFDVSKPISDLIVNNSDRMLVAIKLNELISAICTNAKSANDW